LCDLAAEEDLLADCSPLTSLECSPVSMPITPNLDVSEIPELILNASSDSGPSEIGCSSLDTSSATLPPSPLSNLDAPAPAGTSNKRKRQSTSSNPSTMLPGSSSLDPSSSAAPQKSNKKKRKTAYQKRRSRAKRDQSRKLDEPECDDFENHETYEGAEDKFLASEDVIEVDFDSAKFKTASTGFVGTKAKGLQRPLSLDEVVGPNSKYQFRLVKYTGQYVFPFPQLRLSY
jgi:hypothetical protein